MNWYQIKKYLYYTHDDYVRDIIALHLKKGTLTDIYNYICKTSLFSIEDRFHGVAEGIEDNICNEIILCGGNYSAVLISLYFLL